MQTLRGLVARTFGCITVLPLILTLQSCGSSDSNNNEAVSPEPFADPVDVPTLRAALVTGSPGDNGIEFWECVLSADNSRVTYRLLDDGTGTETLLDNQDMQSAFTWQATSASTMTTTIDQTGTSISFSDITFNGRNVMNIAAPQGLMLACERKGVEPSPPVQPGAPSANNALSYAGVVYPLTHGFEESFLFRPTSVSDPTMTLDTHSNSEFQVANAEFRQTSILDLVVNSTVIVWRPDDATVWLRANLYAPGGDGFDSATFSYVPDSTDERGPEVAGTFFFNDGRFGIDSDQNGDIDSDANEFTDVTGGTISVTRQGNARAVMSFDLTLADGVPLTGSFEGAFPLFAN